MSPRQVIQFLQLVFKLLLNVVCVLFLGQDANHHRCGNHVAIVQKTIPGHRPNPHIIAFLDLQSIRTVARIHEERGATFSGRHRPRRGFGKVAFLKLFQIRNIFRVIFLVSFIGSQPANLEAFILKIRNALFFLAGFLIRLVNLIGHFDGLQRAVVLSAHGHFNNLTAQDRHHRGAGLNPRTFFIPGNHDFVTNIKRLCIFNPVQLRAPRGSTGDAELVHPLHFHTAIFKQIHQLG